MFDLSWGELFIIALIGVLVVGPKELPHVIRGVKSTFEKLRQFWSELTQSFSEVTDEVTQSVEPEVKKIVDLDGNLQEVYDLSDFMPPPNEETTVSTHKKS